MAPSISLILDTRREKVTNLYPVKIRIIFKRVSKYYPTGNDLTEDEWAVIQNSFSDSKTKITKDQKATRLLLEGIKGKAINIVSGLNNFSFKQFETHFYGESLEMGSLQSYFTETITKLFEEERIGTANTFENTLSSLREYKLFLKLKKKFNDLTLKERKELRQKMNIDFEEITPDFLQDYENWMIQQGKSITSVGIYLRNVRSLFNQAISDKKLPDSSYPFGNRKYQIPASRNIKKALTINDVRKIAAYPTPSESTMEMARDFWLFSYLCNGINMKDIAYLKFRNLDGEYIEFIRAKTKRSKKINQKAIRIFLAPQAKEILKRWKKSKGKPDDYLFDIIKPEMPTKKQFDTIHQFVKTVNKYMRVIKEKLEIDKDITTYTARHSFSTVLKRSGVSTEFISEGLGHADIKTTENYLDSFDKDILKEISGKLL